MEYDVVIGIEIHVQLKTKSKMFSASPNTYHMSPNSQTSLYDLSMPGTMPVVNMEAVRYAIKFGTALHMNIDRTLYFDRKNYFYPDLPKGYQITQQDHPIVSHGHLDVTLRDGTIMRIDVQRAHLEEDTCKQTHLATMTLEDYNRCGVPLLEIVTEPCITCAEEAAKYVEGIREIVTFLGISDGRMDEGSMRCDTNVSIKPKGSTVLGTKVEVKNINTVQNVEKAIAFEIERQKKLIESGGHVEQETRRFDEKLQETVLERKKTNAVDYKYFREPNIMPIDLSEKFIQNAIDDMAELPWEFRKEFHDLGLDDYQTEQLMLDKKNVYYFKKCLAEKPLDAKILWNLFMVGVMSYINKSEKDAESDVLTLDTLKFTPRDLVDLANEIKSGKINSKQGKTVLDDMVLKGEKPSKSIEDHGFEQISDTSTILPIVEQVIAAHQDVVDGWHHGKDRSLGYLVGQVMKESHGKANPVEAKKLILEKIGPMGLRD